MTVLVSHNPLFRKLMDIDLPSMDYVVFGSGPMFAHGLTDTPTDIDLVARLSAWDRVREICDAFGYEVTEGHIVLFNGDIEVFTSWAPGEWDVDELIDNAELIDSVPFVPLHLVLRWKERMGHPKDLLHCRLIKDYFRVIR